MTTKEIDVLNDYTLSGDIHNDHTALEWPSILWSKCPLATSNICNLPP
jgi:hypothetical protein